MQGMQQRDGTRLCFNRILLAAENSLSGGKVEAGRMWTILKLKPVRFPKRSDLGWERKEMAGRTPGFWKDRRAVSELGGCMRSLLGEAHWEVGFVRVNEGCPLRTQVERLVPPSPGAIQHVSSAGERGREGTSQLREELSGGCETGGAARSKGGTNKGHTP